MKSSASKMYVAYIFISVILVLIGLVSSVYFIRFLKNTNIKNITLPSLSESLNTILIGIFYLYCAIVMSTHITNSATPTATSNSSNSDNDIAIIDVSEDPITDYYTEPNEEVTTITTEVTPSSNYPNQDFLLHYHKFLENAIKQTTTYKQYKERPKSEERQISSDEVTNSTNFNEENCFEEMFMENSMFLYSFLHSAVSLIISTTKGPEINNLPLKVKKSKKEPHSESSDGDETATTSSSNNVENSTSKENAMTKNFPLVMKILVIFLVPMICILTLYFVLVQNMKFTLATKSVDLSQPESNTWEIISNPINVSTSENLPEVNNIINNIYTIVNATRDKGTTLPTIYNVNTRRRPKQVQECPMFTVTYRIYTLLVFLLYFITTLYAKIKEMEMRANDSKAAKQLNISIIVFAMLWVFSILEMFSKTYLLDSSRSNILTKIFLSLGNLNNLSILTMNYLTAKETIKKYNLVEPQA